MEAYLVIIYDWLYGYINVTPGWFMLFDATLVFVIYTCIEAVYLLIRMKIVSRKANPYQRITGQATKLLVAGDSTAVGTGASDQFNTLAGYLAKDFPQADIYNVAKNGALTSAVEEQLFSVAAENFEGILISTGGNDVWSFTSAKSLTESLRRILRLGKILSNNRVVLIFFGNEGSAPFFPYVFRGLVMYRTMQIKNIIVAAAAEEEVPVIELFTQMTDNPFVTDPARYFAIDGLHPSDAGYWEWYKRFWRLFKKSGHSLLETHHQLTKN
jgi:lysophospholipase L1-like esterase